MFGNRLLGVLLIRFLSRRGIFSANHKFMTRLLLKHGASVPLMVLVGHGCFMNGSFRLALGEYFMAYNSMPNEPILSLCIGTPLSTARNASST